MTLMLIVFIPKFGINAAAITTMASQLYIAILCIPYLKKEYQDLNNFTAIARPVFASAAMAVIVIILKSIIEKIIVRVFVSVLCGATVYFILLIVSRDEFISHIVKGCCAAAKKRFASNEDNDR